MGRELTKDNKWGESSLGNNNNNNNDNNIRVGRKVTEESKMDKTNKQKQQQKHLGGESSPRAGL